MTGAEMEETRRRLGLSKREMCRRLGIAERTWDYWRAGTRNGEDVTPPPWLGLAVAAMLYGLRPVGSEPATAPD